MTAKANGFKLVLEDERVAAWMRITNTFTKDPKTQYDDRNASHGFFIQWGKYERWPDQATMDAIASVDFKPEGTIRRIDLEDPNNTWWIDIHQGHGPHMQTSHLKSLRVTVPPVSLRKYFRPYPGGITLWPDDRLDIRWEAVLHDVKADPHGKGNPHVICTFSLETAVVHVYNNGVLQKGFHEKSTEIVVKYDEQKPPPGQNFDPPQYP